MNKSIVIAAAAVLAAAVSAGAVEIDWNQDVVSQIKTEMPSFRPTATFAAATAEQLAGGVRIEAVSRGSDILEIFGKSWDNQVTLTTNNTGDRVGADYSSCDPTTENSIDSPPTCGYASFSFPQLSVSGKNVYLNGALVATIHKGIFSEKVKLEKGYKLKAVQTKVVVDGGFDRHSAVKVSVYLEKAN
ncbi:MAG: hypothetical protein ACHQ49_05805 [Elusimicrobiota bacterium]